MNNKKGFTLVELLVVISIIAILSVIGVVIFTNVQKSARDAKRRGDLKAIVNALEIYRTSNGRYPSLAGWFCSDSGPNWISGLSSYFASGGVPQSPSKNVSHFFETTNVAPYISYTERLAYCYFTSTYYKGTPGSWYMLVVPLESPSTVDLATKCTAPDGTIFRYGTMYGKNVVMACNQQ